MARGCVMKRGDNYCIKYRVAGRQKWQTVGTNKKEAERLLNEIVHSMDTGEYREITEITLAEFAEKWLKDYVSTYVRERTYQSYEYVTRLHLVPHFGSYKLTNITPGIIEAYVSAVVKTNLKPATIQHHVVTLKTMFKRAVIWGHLKSNPAEYVRGPRIERKEMDFLTPDEIRLFLTEPSPKYYPLFLTAVMTGMRQGELLGLKWTDINWATNQIRVQRAVYKGRFVETKSRTSNRTVAMSPKLASVLKRHKLESPPNNYDLLFANEEGNPIDPCNLVKREFYPALRRAGLRQVRFHDLRHAYASMLLSQGENIKFIQHQMGHSSIQITLDRYGHLLPDTFSQAAERLDATLFATNLLPKAAKNVANEAKS